MSFVRHQKTRKGKDYTRYESWKGPYSDETGIKKDKKGRQRTMKNNIKIEYKGCREKKIEKI
jgi:hypothetical protein